MCGRFFLKLEAEAIAALFDVASWPPGFGLNLPRFNIGPGQEIPVALARDGRRELVELKWGLVPSWADDPAIGFKTMNARSETAHEKPAFREAFRHRRCLIPASGFYEWKEGAAGSKQPYAAFRNRGEPYAMGGLWETWHDPVRGQTMETCTVLTCPANTRLRALHERMPVVVPRVDWSMWLDPRVEGVAPLRAICQPDDAKRWTYHPVSTRVNRVKNEGPGLLDEVMDESAGLFG
jgi:putative SOS response-associated peptidase YedK